MSSGAVHVRRRISLPDLVRRGWVVAVLPAICLPAGAVLVLRPSLAVPFIVLTVTVPLIFAFGGILPVLAVPAVFISWRAGVGGQDLSGADALLLLGVLAALPRMDWNRPLVRRFLGLLALYSVLLTVVLVAHPTPTAIFEWFHRLLLMGGSLVVGASIANEGKCRVGLRLLLIFASVVAVAAALDTVRRGFGPAYPLGLNKNFAGDLLMMAILITCVLPGEVGLPKRILPALRILLLVGLFATQSRGSMIALVAGLFMWAIKDRHLSWRTPLPYLLGLIMVASAVASLQASPDVNAPYGAIGSRLGFRKLAVAAWHESPLVGQGLRFYELGSGGLQSNPHDLIWEALSESGLLGAGALALFLVLSLVWIGRIDHPFAVAALVLLTAKFVHGLFDIYWLAGSLSLPWIVAGMALALGRPGEPSEVADQDEESVSALTGPKS